MAQDFARAFYNSAAWVKCRDGYMQSQNYLCERCGDVATICHHKIHLTADNIHDPYITLNWERLEALCHDCHNDEHVRSDATRDGLSFDENGNLKKIN